MAVFSQVDTFHAAEREIDVERSIACYAAPYRLRISPAAWSPEVSPTSNCGVNSGGSEVVEVRRRAVNCQQDPSMPVSQKEERMAVISPHLTGPILLRVRPTRLAPWPYLVMARDATSFAMSRPLLLRRMDTGYSEAEGYKQGCTCVRAKVGFAEVDGVLRQ